MLYEKMFSSIKNQDTDLFWNLFHDDYEFLIHSTNTIVKKNETSINRIIQLMTEVEIESRRCIFENDEILIYHVIGSYPDGTREAVLTSCLLKDGQIWRQENGSTRLENKEQAHAHNLDSASDDAGDAGGALKEHCKNG